MFINIISYYNLFLYFNLCLSVKLGGFTLIYIRIFFYYRYMYIIYTGADVLCVIEWLTVNIYM